MANLVKIQSTYDEEGVAFEIGWVGIVEAVPEIGGWEGEAQP